MAARLMAMAVAAWEVARFQVTMSRMIWFSVTALQIAADGIGLCNPGG